MKQKLLKFCMLLCLLLVGAGYVNATDFTWDIAKAGYANQYQFPASVNLNSDLTISFDNSGNSSNATKYYTSGTAMRVYAKNKFTISTKTGIITSIDFTFGSSDGSNVITASTGSFTSPKWTSVGASSVTFTIGGTSGNRRISAIKITYTGEGGNTLYSVIVANDIVNGTVTANPTSAAAGTPVTLIATPTDGYEFTSWNVTGATVLNATSATTTFTMPAANVNVSATFTQIQQGGDEPTGDYVFYESFDTNDGTGGNDGQWSGSIASNSIKQDNNGWVYEKGSGAKECAKFGTGSALGSATTPAISASGNLILTFKAAAWNGTNENTNLKLSATNATLSVSSVTLTKGAWTEYSVDITSVTSPITINFEGDNKSNSRFFLDEVKVFAKKDPNEGKEIISIQADASASSANLWKNGNFSHEGVVVTALWDDESETNVTDYCDFSGYDMTSPGQQTVTVKYQGQEAAYTINVQTIENSSKTAYTTQQAKDLYDAGNDLDTWVYVKGKVSTKLKQNYDGSYNYRISDDGTTSNEWTCYSALNFNSTSFESVNQIEVGDDVVVYGKLYFYKNGNYYELDAENYIVLHSRDIKISVAGYTTYYDEYNKFIVPENVSGNTAYVEDGKLLFGEIYSETQTVPAGEPVVLGGAEGKYTLEFTDGDAEDSAKEIGMNDLEGTDKETALTADESSYFYALSLDEDGQNVGFYWMNETGVAFTNGAHKAYLKLPKTETNVKGFAFKDLTDAIQKVETEKNNGIIYNVAGQRVSKAQRGLYIKDGRKFIVK